jgi:anaerobic selenocysteine-containing dehydrogenase
VSKRFKSDKDQWGTAKDFPITCTTYRLTEHFHYWTRHQADGRLNEIQPGIFFEIPEELAKEKGIANGDKVRITSARGAIEGPAMVTRRLRAYVVDGKPLWQIGFPIHWGFSGDSKHAGPLANMLTSFAIDPNTWTPEFKSIQVRLDKVT